MLTLCKQRGSICMSELLQIVDSLENKVSKLLHKMELLRRTNGALENELAALRVQEKTRQVSVSHWEEKYNSLKLANSMLGSTTDKTEAKLKINSLIKQLDYCITQLSE